MNDDELTHDVEMLRTEHRRLDQEIADLRARGTGDQLELARLKKRKLRIKDQIQIILDSRIPDIIA